MRKFGIFLALTLVLVTLTAGCAKSETGASVRGNFTDGESGGDAETLNWILAADASSFSYAGHTIDSLATYDNQLNIQLRCLAKDIEVSADGLVYTVTIRNDLKWSDGSPVTAKDWEYTLKWSLGRGYDFGFFYLDIKNAADVLAKKVPAPKVQKVGGIRVRLWRKGDIERVRVLLSKISNGRKRIKRAQRKRNNQS